MYEGMKQNSAPKVNPGDEPAVREAKRIAKFDGGTQWKKVLNYFYFFLHFIEH